MVMKIISGGQTGADRAGLDFALTHDIPCGGWCPKGRLAEDGRVPDKYPLNETASAEYPERTRKNVEEADATVIFDASGGSRGTKLAAKYCLQARKPNRILSGTVEADVAGLTEFLNAVSPRVLNVAGNRESGTPGMHEHVTAVLLGVKDQAAYLHE